MLIFCFSYEYYLDHLNDHDDDCDGHTSTTSTNLQFAQHVEMAMAEAAAVAVRDVTRLELLVCFHFTLYYNNTFLVPLRNGDGSGSGQYVLFCCFFTIFLYYVYFRLISTYEGINEDSRRDTSRVLRYVFFLIIYIFNYTNEYS